MLDVVPAVECQRTGQAVRSRTAADGFPVAAELSREFGQRRRSGRQCRSAGPGYRPKGRGRGRKDGFGRQTDFGPEPPKSGPPPGFWNEIGHLFV